MIMREKGGAFIHKENKSAGTERERDAIYSYKGETDRVYTFPSNCKEIIVSLHSAAT
jgi:hypothetical protein